jgi:hypothetical protein
METEVISNLDEESLLFRPMEIIGSGPKRLARRWPIQFIF